MVVRAILLALFLGLLWVLNRLWSKLINKRISAGNDNPTKKPKGKTTHTLKKDDDGIYKMDDDQQD